MPRLPISERAWKRLQPFLHHKRPRARVILYLTAAGYTVPQLVKMTVRELRSLRLHEDIAVARDESTDGLFAGDPAFARADHKPLPHTAYYRLYRLAAQAAVGRPMSQEMFRAYIDR